MPVFKQGQVVRVPFPYLDRETWQRRPALVVSTGVVGEARGVLWVVMITSAENRRWVGDVPVEQGYAQAGLPIPSVIRPFKVAAIEAARADAVGQVSPRIMREVLAVVRGVLGSSI